jgi:hypothetical protein
MIGEGPHQPLGLARSLAHLLLGGVTTHWLVLSYKGIPGDVVVVIFEFPLFLLFLLLISI